MRIPGGGGVKPGPVAALLTTLLLLGCSQNSDNPTGADLPKDDTIWIRVSTDGVAPIVTVHASRDDAESRSRPAGVAASPISDADPALYLFRNIEPFPPDVSGWKIRLQSNPGVSGICVQALPESISPELALCPALEPIPAR